MSSVSLSFQKARQGTSWSSSVINPTVMGYLDGNYYDQGALYKATVSVTSGATVNKLTFNIGNISGMSTASTTVYAVIYNYDPTNSFSNNTAPTNFSWRGTATATIYGDNGTSNIKIDTTVSIQSSADYYVFITTNSGSSGLDPFIRGSTNVSCSLTETIPDTPATIINTSSTMYMGSQTTISWSPITSGYTYKVSYKFTDSGTKTVIVSSTSSGSTTFTPPTSLSSLIPNDTSGAITIYVESFKGSTSKGEFSSNFFLNIPTSGRSPTCASGWASASYTAVLSRCIAGYSTINVAIDTSKITYSYNATVDYIIASCNSQSRSDSGSLGTANVGNNVVTVTVYDSRGYSTTYAQTIVGEAYSPPSFTSLSVIRCNSSGTESSTGTYYAVTPNVSFNSYNGANTLTIQTRWQVFGGTYSSYSTISNGVKSSAKGGGNISTNSSYLIEVKATDSVGGTSVQTRTLTNTSVAATFNLKSNGLGAAFFGLADIDSQLTVFGEVGVQSSATGVFTSGSHAGAMIYDRASTNGIYRGNGDGLVTGASGYANLLIKSWNGIGFVDGCYGRGITVGIDCREGHIYSNDITSYGNLSAVNINASGSISSSYNVTAGGQFITTYASGIILRQTGSDSVSRDLIFRNDGNSFYIMPGTNGGWTANAYTIISTNGYWTFPTGLNAGGRVISSILNSSNKGTGTPSGGQDGDIYFQYS